MAHEIESMMYVGDAPWHGLGTALPEAPTVGEAIKLAGLDWVVSTQTLKLVADDGQPHRKIPALATVRESDGAVLGVVGPDYKVLQNADAFNFFDPFVASGAARLETAGSLRGGRRIWVLARLPGGADILPGDAVEQFLLLSNSHDGTLAVRVGYTPVRVVCQNTLSAAHASRASQLLRIRHVGDPAAALEEVQRVVNLAARTFEATTEQYRALAAHHVEEADIRAYVKEIFAPKKPGGGGDEGGSAPDGNPAPSGEPGGGSAVGASGEEPEDTSRKGERVADSIMELVESGRGADLPGVRGTLWGAYNAVTEYLNHERGRDADVRLDSLWFGGGAALGKRALDLAVKMTAA